MYSNNSPARPKRTISKTNSESDEKLSSSLENSFIKFIQKQGVTFQQKPFHPFEIEFLEPQFYKVNCIRLLSYNEENSLTTYRGVDVNSNEIYSIYEWKYVLEKNKIYEKKKYDICLLEVSDKKIRIYLKKSGFWSQFNLKIDAKIWRGI